MHSQTRADRAEENPEIRAKCHAPDQRAKKVQSCPCAQHIFDHVVKIRFMFWDDICYHDRTLDVPQTGTRLAHVAHCHPSMTTETPKYLASGPGCSVIKFSMFRVGSVALASTRKKAAVQEVEILKILKYLYGNSRCQFFNENKFSVSRVKVDTLLVNARPARGR